MGSGMESDELPPELGAAPDELGPTFEPSEPAGAAAAPIELGDALAGGPNWSANRIGSLLEAKGALLHGALAKDRARARLAERNRTPADHRTDPMTSPEKVRAALAQAIATVPELQRQAAGINAVMLAPLMGFLPRIEQMAHERIPTDPAVLDLLLERAAAMVLELKSDPEPEAIEAAT
jgi:hypothetical protein